MNLLDRAIGLVSPDTALRRVKTRLALDYVSELRDKRAERFRYDGATSGRRAHGWYAASTDANVELMGALIWLRNRSRDLVRNNPHAAKALEELVGNTVGTGIVPQAKTGNAKLDRIIDGEWPYFVEQCDTPQRLDFYGMQALVMRSTAESGEGIIRYRPRLPQAALRVPLQLQILEADFLDQTRTMGLINGHVMQGVQFDMLGRRVAYWLFSYHPGGVLILNPRGGIISQPVPAEQIMHIYRVLRPGQVRGVPWMTPSMMAFRDLDDYRDAEGVRKKIEACVVAFVTQPEGIAGTPLGIKDTDPQNDNQVESFEPAMIEYLKPGQDVRFNNPQGAGGYSDYVKTELHRIAAGIGTPYEVMTGDLSQTTYSSWRGGMLGFRNTIEGYRWLTLVPMFCSPVRRRFIDTLVLQGKIPAAAVDDEKLSLYATQWTAPKFESVDPLKDTMADLKRIRMGVLTLTEAIAQNGYDPDGQLEEIARINAKLDKLEIILDCDPRNVTDRGQEQPAGTEERTPSAKPAVGAPKGQGLSGTPGQGMTAEEVRHQAGQLASAADHLTAQALRHGSRRWESSSRLYVN
ncbi:MAG TPA: phage portal protein [Bryobacteraceae bacterium]|nr:phage portal protein [Bryobacteraceae bacterium]